MSVPGTADFSVCSCFITKIFGDSGKSHLIFGMVKQQCNMFQSATARVEQCTHEFVGCNEEQKKSFCCSKQGYDTAFPKAVQKGMSLSLAGTTHGHSSSSQRGR